MNLVVFGPPGVGKGTQGDRLAGEYGLTHLSMGDILRAAVQGETEAGLQAKQLMDAGKMVPDAVAVSMIEDRIAPKGSAGEARFHFVLDGFPRNVKQAEALNAMLDAHDLSIDRIVFMDAREEILLKRLCGRLVCKACGFGFHRQYSPPLKSGCCDRCGGELYQRADDRDDVIAHRLEVYREQTAPLLDFYRHQDGFFSVDASGETDAVYAALKKVLTEAVGD